VLLTLVLDAVITPIIPRLILPPRHTVILGKIPHGNIVILLKLQPEVIAIPVRLRVLPKSWLVRAVLVTGEATAGMRVAGAVPPNRPHTTTAAMLIATSRLLT
jgi:hypothetical protein